MSARRSPHAALLAAHRLRGRLARGLTLVELVVCMAIVPAIASIAMPACQTNVATTERVAAQVDVRELELKIERFFQIQGVYPETLADVGADAPLDPCGNPYQYLCMQDPPPSSRAGGSARGQARKDHNLAPTNTDFDLYRMGPDGRTAPPLTAAMSRDDIVRANNGRYIGDAANY